MAVFLLGGLITELVGSIGGTTFKRQGSSHVMMKKSNGASRSRLLQNPRLVQNSYIFKKWQFLDFATQQAWILVAAQNKVLDNFGNFVNISGIAFQRKCDLQVNFLNMYPNPFSWSASINTYFFATVPEVDWTNSTLFVNFDLPQGNTFLALALEYSLQPLQDNSFNYRRVFFHHKFEDGVPVNVFDEMVNTYGINDSLYVLRVFAYAFTASGVVGTVIREKVLAIG